MLPQKLSSFKARLLKSAFNWVSILLISKCTFVFADPLPATKSETSASSIVEQGENTLESWWNGKYGTGDWFGIRNTLEDHGIKFGGFWKGQFFMVTSDGIKSPVRTAFEEEIKFTAFLDFQKLIGIAGLTGETSFRWRDGSDGNQYIGADTFKPTSLQGGKGWRMGSFYLTWVSQDLLWTEDAITVSGGWINPYFFFARQTLSNLFQNDGISGVKGIGKNIPWTSNYNAWGGHIRFRPVDWHYLQFGAYMAIPDATRTENHGYFFEGYGPDTSMNGFLAMAETGVTPKISSYQLPGKYAFGSYYFGAVVNTTASFPTGSGARDKYGFYWQADQMLFREPSKEQAPLLSKGPTDGKEVVENSATPPQTHNFSDQGLYIINFVHYAPKNLTVLPFYFHTGLIYQGLIPTRDKDQFGVVFGYGNYSYDKIEMDKATVNATTGETNATQSYEAVIEVNYRIQLNKWAYFSPFWQYVIRPGGTGDVKNANVFGFQTQVNF